MKNISSFFSSFNNKASIEINKRLIISSIIKKCINIDIDIKNITIVNGVVNIKTSNIIKNEIVIKKNKIIEDINSSIKDNIVNIR
jgi:hypothetical protein